LGDTSLNGKLFVAYDASLNSRLVVGSDVTVNKRLFTVGDSSLNGKLFVAYDASLNSRLVVGSDVTVNKRLFTVGDSSLNGKLFVAYDASLNSRLVVGSDVTVNKRLFTVGDVSFNNGNLFVGLDTSLNGNLVIGKDLTIKGRLNVQNYTNNNIINTTVNNYQLIVSEDLSLNGRLVASGDATINGLTVGKGSGSISTNTVLGISALASNTTGGNNTVVGYQAGYAGTANTTGSNNTFVGYQAKANGSGYTNSTALGAGAEITASNQVVLGTTTETVVIPNQINFNYISNPTLAVGSIGYRYVSSISSITISNNSQGLLSTISSVPIGVYLVQYLTTYYDIVGNATNTRIKTFAGITSFGTQIATNNVIHTTVNDYISATLSIVYTNTAVSNFQLNCALNGASTSIKSYISEGGYFIATRIA
jgi:hypothetical protein